MPELLTHTKRQAFKNCRRYYFNRHELHLTIKRQRTGRRRGSIFGSALFQAHQGHDVEPFINSQYDEMEPRDTQEADELELERIKMLEVVPAYIAQYGTDRRREVVYQIPLVNPYTKRRSLSKTFELAGKIDGIVVTGRHTCDIIEDKIAESIQRAMIDRLPLDDQATEYVLALASRGWQARVRYRHTRWPGINPQPARGKREAETLGDYQARLRDDLVERRNFYFDEQILMFPTDHLEDYMRGRWETAAEIVRARWEHQRGRNSFYKTTSRCHDWGGCEFIPLCTNRAGAGALYEIEPLDNPELGGQNG